MDYEKKYKEALELARDYYKANLKLDKVDENLILEDIFPELKESEDDRIRKAIVATIHLYYGEPLEDEAKEMIAWIEKQGEQILANSAKTCKDEQKPTDEEMKTLLRTEYEKGRADAIAEMQKPTWCEDDEKIGKELIGFCIKCSQGNTVVSSQDDFTRWATWLKSIKDRHTWKPSDKQMKALHDLNLTGNISYAGQGQVLIKLYNDLERLLKI